MIVSLRLKLFVIFIAISTIPVALIAIMAYKNYTNMVSDQISIISSNIIDNSINKISNTIKDITRVSETFMYQQSSATNSVKSVLLKNSRFKENLNDYDLLQGRKELQFICESLMYSSGYINGIYVFTNGGNCFDFSKNNDLRLGYDVKTSEWFKNTLESKGKLYTNGVSENDFLLNPSPSISFSQVQYDFGTKKMLGVLLINCSLNIFSDIDKTSISDQTSIYLIDENGKIIYDNSRTKIGTSLEKSVFNRIDQSKKGSFTYNSGKTMVVYNSFPRFGWKLAAQISTSQMKANFEPTRNFILFISFALTIISFILALILSNSFTKPIKKLSNFMKNNHQNQNTINSSYLSLNDEVGVLYNEYNEMVNKISAFIKEQYQNKLVLLDSQMKALEAQINSHFLYNTLGSINSIAKIEKIESIETMSKALGDMFRYSIKTTSELVPLAEELNHVNNYLIIQKIRYGPKITYAFNIQEDLLQSRILKLILQPIVENSLYHGLELKKGKGELKIDIWSEAESMILEVEDNGVGMSSDQAAKINEFLKEPPSFSDLGKRDKQSIGIKNVHSRIELYYGNNYGLTFESCLNEGTKVRIRIPLVKEPEA